jgi:hypothetical protein
VDREINWGRQTFKLRDLLAHKDFGDTSKKLECDLEAHDVIVFRLSPKK